MFSQKGKHAESRLESTPQEVEQPLVNGSYSPSIHSKEMDPDSSVVCDTQVSSNTRSDNKTILLEDSSVSLEVGNITQNLLLNVSPSVGNITAIQNVVPSANPTLWLPTVITSNTSPPNHTDGLEGSPNHLSQIIFSGNGTHSTPVLTTSTNIQANNKYTPKVQILTIPKQQAPVTQNSPMSSMKNMLHTTYISQGDAKPKSTSCFHNSVLNNQSIPYVSIGNHQHKLHTSVSSSNLQVGNNIPSSTSGGGRTTSHHHSHVLSRVVPGPKMSTQPSRSIKKSNNMQHQKVQGRSSTFSNMIQSQNIPSPMSVKIIQQQNIALNNKSALKSIPPSRTGVVSNKQKNSTPNPGYSLSNSHKQGGLNKSVGRNIPQRLVVQQTPSRMMMSGYNRSATYYPNDSDYVVKSSPNQSLTAQILESLSHPKVMSSNRMPIGPCERNVSPHHIKQLQGDPTMMHTPDDTLGIEERPSLPDDSLSFHYYRLQLVMLDHTYSVTPQSIAVTTTTNISTPTITNTPVSGSELHMNDNSPACSPVKTLPSPSKSPMPLPSISHIVKSAAMENKYSYVSKIPKVEEADDDAASVLSSIDGDERRPTNGSDTETAPEGEEEGKTRCVCEFTHDDGYMICCDRCGEWQHVDCMAIDRQNIPDDYMCDRCQPRLIDRKRARSIQMRKKEELSGLYSSASDSSSGPSGGHKRPFGNKTLGGQKKLVTITTYSNTSSGVSRSVPMLASQPTSYTGVSTLPPIGNKRGPKRPRRVDTTRKGPKRKLPDKKIGRKSDVAKYRNKYCTNSTQQANQWNNTYELAMTNHYSPELRAKIARYFSNKIGSNHNVMTSVLTAHFCTTVPHAGSKILIATKDMKENAAIIELRGKYMLSTQHKPLPQPAGRAGSQRPGPYLFFYKFPKDPTQVCIDTRTYGNEARFVRRSCKPNAELQHCIIKGALHVYLVTISPIQSNTEITIRHDSSGSLQPCACGNPKYCKQSSSSSSHSTDIIHKNNGASIEPSGRERRGRARHISTSLTNTPPIVSPTRKELLSPKVDKRRKSEPEAASLTDTKPTDDNIKHSLTKLEPNLQSDLEAIKGIDIKEESKGDVISTIKDETPIKEEKDVEIKQEVLSENICKKEDILPHIKSESPEQTDDMELSKFPNESLSSCVQVPNTESAIQKLKEGKSGVAISNRRTSTHSVRTTRASLSASITTESADEKSDSQVESKTTAKEKKKMTREERKMEAIVKAIERMEKAEQRKLENKDKQTKRRESDPQQPCSESKDVTDGPEENQQKCNTKGRPRRRGRSRTTSQTKSLNRINSVDSDNIGTSEDEHNTSLTSPSRKSSSCDNYLDASRVSSTEAYRSLVQTDEALKKSFDRIKYGLSSVCLLVEAAVAPLETTFKSPKTKKAIMNEWLSKSPEPNMSYDIASPDYAPPDNNNTNENYSEKTSFIGRKCTENLVKAASTMIGNLSGGIISADSTPEKYAPSDPSDSEAKHTPECYSPPALSSPIVHAQRASKRLIRDLSRDPGEKSKTPKKMRRSVRNMDPSPIKRCLRSGGGNREADSEGDVNMKEEKIVEQESDNNHPVTTSLPPPPQHSAKKRWLRQAISEESDSPTAESPPNEMLTPLKKRRLARESLTSESTLAVQSDDVSSKVVTTNKEPDCDVTSTNDSISYPSTNVDEEKKDECVPSESVYDTLETIVDKAETPKEEEICPADTSISCKEQIAEESFVVQESTSCVHSTETSCNSSPVLDEMDDIQKKIHSFHTENILILKSRNKKEKRKKVNLNFDLSVLADDTVEVKLKCEKEMAEIVENSKSEEDLVNSNLDACNANSNQDTDDSNTNVEQEEVSKEQMVTQDVQPIDDIQVSNITPNHHFPSSTLFSDTFSGKSLAVEESNPVSESPTLPNMDIIKNVIDMTVNLESSVFKDTRINAVDEYKNVEEILSRVNQMDSRNSVLLSGLIKESGVTVSPENSEATPLPTPKPTPRPNDPRLNPPPSDKPKPIRRKLSITEYRRRHSMVHPSESSSPTPPTVEATQVVQTLLSDEEEDISQFEKKLEASLTKVDNILSNINMGIFNAQPSVHEKHREKLSERLRREFGLTIPEEEMACTSDKKLSEEVQEDKQQEVISSGVVLSPAADPSTRLDG